ncbi:MAG: hypothetical protein ACFCUJ_15360 [Thiotrichales bacterium]
MTNSEQGVCHAASEHHPIDLTEVILRENAPRAVGWRTRGAACSVCDNGMLPHFARCAETQPVYGFFTPIAKLYAPLLLPHGYDRANEEAGGCAMDIGFVLLIALLGTLTLGLIHGLERLGRQS